MNDMSQSRPTGTYMLLGEKKMQPSLEIYSEENIHAKFVMLKKKEKKNIRSRKKIYSSEINMQKYYLLQILDSIKSNSFRFFD